MVWDFSDAQRWLKDLRRISHLSETAKAEHLFELTFAEITCEELMRYIQQAVDEWHIATWECLKSSKKETEQLLYVIQLAACKAKIAELRKTQEKFWSSSARTDDADQRFMESMRRFVMDIDEAIHKGIKAEDIGISPTELEELKDLYY